MAPGARNKFGAPMFKPEVFRKQMYCIEEVPVTLLGLFGAPCTDLVPRKLCSPVTPLHTVHAEGCSDKDSEQLTL